MKVELNIRCLEQYIPKYWSDDVEREKCQKLAEQIQQKALEKWMNKKPEDVKVRFVYKMADNHFRFFKVSLKNKDTLIVHH